MLWRDGDQPTHGLTGQAWGMLVFVLRAIRNHWRILSRRRTRSGPDFSKITNTVVWEEDEKTAWMNTGRSVTKVQAGDDTGLDQSVGSTVKKVKRQEVVTLFEEWKAGSLNESGFEFPQDAGYPSLSQRYLKRCGYVYKFWVFSFWHAQLSCLPDILVSVLSNQLDIRIRGRTRFVSTQ